MGEQSVLTGIMLQSDKSVSRETFWERRAADAGTHLFINTDRQSSRLLHIAGPGSGAEGRRIGLGLRSRSPSHRLTQKSYDTILYE